MAQILLPALGTLYFALAKIWGLPSAEEVVGTIVAVDTFLGTLLQLSSMQYKKLTAHGVMKMTTDNKGTTVYGLELPGDPEYELAGKDRVIFKVVKGSASEDMVSHAKHGV